MVVISREMGLSYGIRNSFFLKDMITSILDTKIRLPKVKMPKRKIEKSKEFGGCENNRVPYAQSQWIRSRDGIQSPGKRA